MENNKETTDYSFHPAWGEFRTIYFPAEEAEAPEFLTTPQVLERLNSIIEQGEFPERYLHRHLKESGFKQLLPPPGGVFLWMVKDTSMKMITGAVL